MSNFYEALTTRLTAAGVVATVTRFLPGLAIVYVEPGCVAKAAPTVSKVCAVFDGIAEVTDNEVSIMVDPNGKA